MNVSEHQLAFDLDQALTRLVDQLRARRHRHLDSGAERLLVALVNAGLDEHALVSAAALVLELDNPQKAPAS